MPVPGGGAPGNKVTGLASPLSANLDLGSNLIVGNGGSTGIAISSAGEVTMAAQSAVLALNSADDDDVTGDGTTVTIDFDTEIYDQNADFATDTFTAPIAGRYLISAQAFAEEVTDATSVNLTIVSSNRNYTHSMGGINSVSAGNDLTVMMSAVVDMDASDTVIIRIQGAGGTKIIDIGGATAPKTFVSAILLV